MTHVDDGALLRYLDGNSEDGRHGGTAEHLSGCLACRNRLEEIRSTLEFVSDSLCRTDVPARGSVSNPLRWKYLAAAAIIVLTATTLFTPVRAWVVRNARALLSKPDVTADEPLPQPKENTASESESGTVSFSFGREVFLLEIASPQDSGLLSIEIEEGHLASATMSGALRAETFVILPTGLRILNSGESTTSYLVSVPETVSRIEVVVAHRPPTELEPSRDQRSWTLELNHF